MYFCGGNITHMNTFGVLEYRDDKFIWNGGYHTRNIPKSAKMTWNPMSKQWETRSLESAKYLINYATDDVKRIIDQQSNEEKIRLQLSSAADTVVDDIREVPCPENLSLYRFQTIGVNLLIRDGNKLLADELGLGKTIQVIGAMNITCPRKVVIACPGTLTYNWKKEIEKWSIHDYKIQVITSKKYIDTGADIYIVSYGMTISDKLKWMHKIKCDLLIGDESHELKSRSAKRSKMFKKISKGASKIILITGTPALNRPFELYNLLLILKFEIPWFEYINRYCDAQTTEYGIDYTGASNLDELQYILRKSLMIRRLKSDVLTELPEKTRQIIYCDPSTYGKLINREGELISKHAMESMDYDSIIDRLSIIEFETIGQIAEYRKKTAIAKLPDVIAHLDTLRQSEDKIVVFAHHREVIDRLHLHYGNSAVKLYGGMSDREKNDVISEFQTNPDINFFIGAIHAAGVGITLTAARIEVIIEMDWTPGIMTQVEDRIHRIGQEQSVLIQYMVVDGSIDALLAKKLTSKTNTLSVLFNPKYIETYIPEEITPLAAPVQLTLDISEGVRVYSYIEKMRTVARLRTLVEQLPETTVLSDEMMEYVVMILSMTDIISNRQCKECQDVIDILEKLL